MPVERITLLIKNALGISCEGRNPLGRIPVNFHGEIDELLSPVEIGGLDFKYFHISPVITRPLIFTNDWSFS